MFTWLKFELTFWCYHLDVYLWTVDIGHFAWFIAKQSSKHDSVLYVCICMHVWCITDYCGMGWFPINIAPTGPLLSSVYQYLLFVSCSILRNSGTLRWLTFHIGAYIQSLKLHNFNLDFVMLFLEILSLFTVLITLKSCKCDFPDVVWINQPKKYDKSFVAVWTMKWLM